VLGGTRAHVVVGAFAEPCRKYAVEVEQRDVGRARQGSEAGRLGIVLIDSIEYAHERRARRSWLPARGEISEQGLEAVHRQTFRGAKQVLSGCAGAEGMAGSTGSRRLRSTANCSSSNSSGANASRRCRSR
jgi:hypothetical protein